MQTQAAYLAVGPIYPTPTKPDRSAVTLDYVRWATAHIDRPWFAIGGITLDNVDEVLEAGARRICVVSAILNLRQPALHPLVDENLPVFAAGDEHAIAAVADGFDAGGLVAVDLVQTRSPGA